MRTSLSACLSVLLLAWMAGCQERPVQDDDKNARLPIKEDHAGHDHPEEGPHGGQLIELGQEDYHAEAVHDHDAGRLTFYILDNKAAASVPVDQTELDLKLMVDGKPKTYKVPAVPLDGETGQSSRFEIVDKELIEALYHSPNPNSRINITIAGKSFVGDFEPKEDHEDHDHDHEHEEEEHEHEE